MKKLGLFILIVISLGFFYFYQKTDEEVFRVGVVVPVQNVALDDIVAGFKQELANKLGKRNFDVQVHNALGDINLQKSGLNKFINDKVNLLVPIGKGASLMAANLAPASQPILFLAANIPPKSIVAEQRAGLMGVIDEISVETQLKFMRAVIPELNKFTVIYVSSDKVFDDVKDLNVKANALGISVQQLMVQNLSELYTIASRIESDSQAIFTLKDVMVASGINALVQQANALKIPLITSDEGTVKSGAAFAVGVTEADIGRHGARIAKEFFDESKFSPIQYLENISVFINTKACHTQGIDVNAVKDAAIYQKLAVVEG